jgi:hypothetical protein
MNTCLLLFPLLSTVVDTAIMHNLMKPLQIIQK